MEVNWLTQGLGILGFIAVVLTFQMKTRQRILSGRIAAGFFFLLHYALLGAWTGSGMNVLAIARTWVFKKRTESRWASTPLWLYFFIGCYVLAGLLTWEGYHSLLPVAGMVIGSFAFWSEDPKQIRFLNLFPSIVWFIYNWIVQSVPGMVADIFVLTSVAIGIIRFDILHQKEPKN